MKKQVSVTLAMVHVIVTTPNYLLINMHIDMCIGTKNLYQTDCIFNHVLKKWNGGYTSIELILLDLIPTRYTL
jgi:hypothetical protein